MSDPIWDDHIGAWQAKDYGPFFQTRQSGFLAVSEEHAAECRQPRLKPSQELASGRITGIDVQRTDAGCDLDFLPVNPARGGPHRTCRLRR